MFTLFNIDILPGTEEYHFKAHNVNTMASKNYPPTIISTEQTPEEEVCALVTFASNRISDYTSVD